MILSTLDKNAWNFFLSEFNQRVEDKAKSRRLQGRTVEHGREVWRASPDRHWTVRESKERANRKDDLPKEAEAGYRGQTMQRKIYSEQKTDDKRISVEVDGKK